MVAYRVNNNLVPSVFVYRSSECHAIIVLTGINIPINIDICNTFEVYFQIFRNFGYKELKNSDYSRYSDDLEGLGFEQATLVTDGGNANYRIEVVEAGENGFKAQAVSVVDFDKDGVFNVWEIDQDKNLKETVKD